MKIALAHKRLDRRGGTERDFYLTAEGLRNLGHEVHLFCGEFGVPAPEGVRTHKVPSVPLGRTARLLSFAFLAPRAISRHRCDVVVSFGRMVRQDVLRSGGGTHRAFLRKMEQNGRAHRWLWHRLSLYHRSVLAVERLQYGANGHKKILAVSEEVKREIISHYRVPEERISVIYNGVDHERFHPRHRDRARARVRAEWGIAPQAPLVLFVGSGFERKGLDCLLKVWKSPRLKEVCLLVVGEDAQRARYASWAARESGGRIRFTGRQEAVEEFYGAADILALPARQEAFGNVVLEALASGLPVLVSKSAGAAEVLADGLEGGILERPDDPAEMETKLLRLLEPGHWPRFSERARRLGERYSWTNHFRALESYLQTVAGENRANFS